MKPTALFMLLFTLQLLHSCSSERNATTKTADIESNVNKEINQGLSLDSLCISYRLIPIDTAILAGNLRIFDIDAGNYYLEDGESIIVIDRVNGERLSQFKHTGRGPQEYMNTMKSAAAPSSKRVYVLDNSQKKLLSYKYNGEFVSSKNLTGSVTDIESDEDGNILLCSVAGANLACRLSPNLDVISEYFPCDTSKREPMIFTNNSIRRFNNQIYLQQSDCDTLYTIEETPTAEFIIKLGKLRMPSAPLDINSDAAPTKYIMGEHGWLIKNLYFTQYFYDTKAYYDIYDIDNNSLVYRNITPIDGGTPGISASLNGSSLEGFWPKFARNDKAYYIVDGVTANAMFPDKYAEESNGFIVEVSLKQPTLNK